jgi:hypothetical protein
MAMTTIEQYFGISPLAPLPSSEQVKGEVENTIAAILSDVLKVNKEVSHRSLKS